MQSFALITICFVALVASAPPPTKSPRTNIPTSKPNPVDNGPIASDFWALAGRSLITRFAMDDEEMSHHGELMIRYLTCVPNQMHKLVKKYGVSDVWEVYSNYYMDAFEEFAQCSLHEHDEEYEICQRQNFFIATRSMSSFYSDLRMRADQKAFEAIPKIIDRECRVE